MAKDTVTDRIPEWKLQAHIAAHLDSRIALASQDTGSCPFAYAASLEGVIGNLNPYQSKLAIATGVKKGEPDLRLYFAGGRIVFVELKEATTGKLTDSQKVRIPLLRRLGFTVHVVHATTCDEGVALVGAIVEAELESPGSSAAMVSATWWPKERGK